MLIRATSCGGSSYTPRIIVQMLKSDNLVITIGKGGYQDQVFNRVNKELDLLDKLLSKYCGVPTRIKTVVRKK